ncbi:MAG: hypothetical protein HYZ29_24930 [Myxococcales bacterium]|nr:hypothetical protein [Myxococcales bacterium]
MLSHSRKHLHLLIVLGSTATMGCGETSYTRASGDNSPDDQPVAYTGTLVSTTDGTKFVGDKIAIDVRNGPGEVQVDAHVLAFSQAESWTAMLRLPSDHVPKGTGTAQIRQVPLQPGVGYVERHKGDQATKADDGTMTYEFDGKHARIRVDSGAPGISASLDATYAFRCWVPPSELGLAGTGQGPPGAVEVVLDESFKSAPCVRYRPQQ